MHEWQCNCYVKNQSINQYSDDGLSNQDCCEVH